VISGYTSDTTRTNTFDNVVSQYSHDMNLLPWADLEPKLLTCDDIDMILNFCCDILLIDKHVFKQFLHGSVENVKHVFSDWGFLQLINGDCCDMQKLLVSTFFYIYI
jgi:hypothetical protein